MDQRKRRRLLQKIIGVHVALLGFVHHSSVYFVRERSRILDVFFFQQSRSNNTYTIAYGADCPDLLQDLRASSILSPEERPMLLIDNGCLETDREYFCKYEDHIEKSAAKVALHLSAEAEPWLRKMKTAEDLVKQYWMSEVRVRKPGAKVPAGQILRWGIYGLLLDDIGDRNASGWLTPVMSAYDAGYRTSPEDKEWIRIIKNRLAEA